jgi:peptidoglycan/LPS O-acetylase OafA/YrhL
MLSEGAPLVSRRYAGLDVVRFISAALVMLFHLTYSTWTAPGTEERFGSYSEFTARIFGTTFSFGWVGVEIFFVISGFVIAMSAEHASPSGFLRNRLLRLAPVMWIAAAILAGVMLAEGGSYVGITFRFLSSLVFQPLGPWVSAVYWTLQVEIVFYLLVFLLLRFSRFERIEYLAIAVGIPSSIFWLAHTWVPAIEAMPSMQPLSWFIWEQAGAVLLLRHGCFFTLGIFLRAASARGWSIGRIVLLAFFACISLIEVHSKAGLMAQTAELGNISMSLAMPIVVWVVAMLALSASIFLPDIPWFGGRWQSLTRILGLSTFPLYLLHERLGAAVIAASEAFGVGGWWSFIAGTSIPLLLSIVIAAKIEPAVRKAMASFIDERVIYLSRNPSRRTV